MDDQRSPNTAGQGTLAVSVKTGRGRFPVADATVTVQSEKGRESDIEAVVTTDAAGIAPVLLLSAGDFPYLTPDREGEIFTATYTVEVEADGFYGMVRYGVPVYSGVQSEQTFFLTPLPAGKDPDPTGGDIFYDGVLTEDGNG